jgi:phosphatidylglycerol---prolipoprotein diacylglyceryl transferase
MLPVLQIGPLALQTYPLALLLAGWLALALSGRIARRLGIDDDHVYNAGLYALIAGVIVGRLAHVIAYWQAYRTQPLEIFGFNTQAFLLWPGLAGALAVGGWYINRHKLPLIRFLDALAPGLLVGLAVAATGALLVGRVPGAPADLPWSVDLWGVRRHPSQLYETLVLLGVAAVVLWLIWQGSRAGAPALVSLLGYGLMQWLLEPFRAESATILGGLRAAQVIGLGLALLALWGLGTGQRPEPGSVEEGGSAGL